MELEITHTLSGHTIRRKLIAPKITTERIELPAGTADVEIPSSSFEEIYQAILLCENWEDGEIDIEMTVNDTTPVTGHIGCVMVPDVVPGSIRASVTGDTALTLLAILAGV